MEKKAYVVDIKNLDQPLNQHGLKLIHEVIRSGQGY